MFANKCVTEWSQLDAKLSISLVLVEIQINCLIFGGQSRFLPASPIICHLQVLILLIRGGSGLSQKMMAD